MDELERLWRGTPPPPGGQRRVRPATRNWPSRLLAGVLAAIGLLVLLSFAKSIYTDWLWFQDLGYADVYTTILGTRVAIFFVMAAVFAGLFTGNLILATRLSPLSSTGVWPWMLVSQLRRISKWSVIGATAVLGLIFGLVAQGSWLTLLQAANAQSFGVADPLFGRDISFFVFTLPLQRAVHGWLLGAVVVTLVATLTIYALSYAVQRLRLDFSRRVLAHVGGLAIAVLGLIGWGYRLSIWEVVFSPRGVVFGASYSDIHAKIPAQWTLLSFVVVCAIFFGVAIYRRRLRWAAYGLGSWLVAVILVGAAFPAIVQRFQVEPNELAREMPYIEYNIQYTRQAFGLDRVEEQDFPAETSPTAEDIAENTATIKNIRLWDHRPLKDTFNQIQSIRLYYEFNDVDVDRYTVDGEYRQVMLAARELSPGRLASEAQTWVNRRLQFTHGYGIAMSPVNEVSLEGLPTLLVQDLPPVGIFQIERPELYFGELTNEYVIVRTKTDEFDYPAGEDNVYTQYRGEGGVRLGGFFRRLAYAWQMGDFNILISRELTPESRILYYRNIKERVQRIAPFLVLDRDPYLVVTDGRLLWVQDAYTVTDRYPYSEPHDGINYIRNSVKVVVDAYNGTTTFYTADAGDAMVRTYAAIFPGLFVPAEQMPEFLKEHRRYPEDMFSIQATVYQSYHMEDARVFYNKEDLWAVPREVYAGGEQLMEPYYVIMRLPGEPREEFLLMLPFTPVNKNNTIGWLAARCDGDSYGRLLAYHFPKDRLVYGPSQIENRIQQNTTITEQLALWARGGSRVIRGNLLLIPIGRSNLYVEPVFLQAETGGLPELKRVIVAAGDRIAMEPGLEASLAVIFGEAPPSSPVDITTEEAVPELPAGPLSPEVAALVKEARLHYERAQERLRQGDWAGYGQELRALDEALARLETITAGQE